MKSSKLFLFGALFFMASASFAFAQSPQNLELSSDNGITLQNNSAISSEHFIDISQKNFSKDQATQATNYLAEKSSLVEMELDFGNQVIIVRLKTDAPETQGWGISEWQNELKTIK